MFKKSIVLAGMLTLIAKSSKFFENALKQPHWAQARSSCWGHPLAATRR